MMSMLQPLDICMDKSLKDALKWKWNLQLANDNHTSTARAWMCAPTLVEIVQWIDKIWLNLNPQLIVKGFLKCCISNAVDGSEDDFLWRAVNEAIVNKDHDSDSSDNDNDLLYENNNKIAEEKIGKLFNSDNNNQEFEGC